MVDKADGSPLTHGLSLAWGITPPPRRGPKPAHTVADIVETALALADREGATAISLPKIATALNLTPNALYRYVTSKDELLLLVTDAGTGPPPTRLPAGWRAGSAAWVRALIDRYRSRPWLAHLPIRGAPVTPNMLGWLESLLGALDRTSLPPGDQLSCATLLDSYARSTAALIHDLTTSNSAPVQSADVFAFLHPRLADHGYPLIARMLSSGIYADSPAGPDPEFGLTRLLDGIERLIEEQP
jgi:AcrR family transcriptional regulator